MGSDDDGGGGGAAASKQHGARGACVALFLGSVVAPFIFKDLMSRAPEYGEMWAVLHPVHGLVVYSLVLLQQRPSASRKLGNPLHALPIAALFALHNTLKADCGRAVSGTLVHLTDQMAPLATMGFAVLLFGRRYPFAKWAAAAALVASVAFFVEGTRDDKMLTCVAKTAPLGLSLLYVERFLRAHAALHPTSLWWWVCAWQLPATLIGTFFRVRRGGGSITKLLSEGLACYWLGRGDNSRCRGAPVANFLGAAASAAVNFALPIVARDGGAPLCTYIRALTLPVVAGLFTFVEAAEVLDARKIIGLAAATASVLLWASG